MVRENKVFGFDALWWFGLTVSGPFLPRRRSERNGLRSYLLVVDDGHADERIEELRVTIFAKCTNFVETVVAKKDPTARLTQKPPLFHTLYYLVGVEE